MRRLDQKQGRIEAMIVIRGVGLEANRRYVLLQDDGRVWTGEGWDYTIRGARTFAGLRDAREEYERLALLAHAGQPVREFEAAIRVRVFADRPFTLEELRDYLVRATRLGLDVDANGEGPVPGSLVLQAADFDGFREVTRQGPVDAT
jgi:hypothetical protein